MFERRIPRYQNQDGFIMCSGRSQTDIRIEGQEGPQENEDAVESNLRNTEIIDWRTLSRNKLDWRSILEEA